MKTVVLLLSFLFSIASYAQLGRDVVPFRKGDLWGLKSADGKVILEPKYNSFSHFNQRRLAMVELGGKYGFVDKEGKVIVPIEYDHFVNDNENSFDGSVPFPGGLISARRNGKFGFISTGGEETTGFIYEELSNIHGNPGSAIAKLNGKYGYISSSGKTTVDFIYDHASGHFTPVSMVKKNGKVGYINQFGSEVVEIKYDELGQYKNKIKAKLNGKYGYINDMGRTLVPFKYEDLRPTSSHTNVSDFSWAKQEGKWGLIDKSGKELTNFDFDQTGSRGSALIVKKNNKWGAINVEGKQILDFNYDAISRATKNNLHVQQNGSWGLVSGDNGSVLVPIIYDQDLKALYGYENGFVAILNGKKGIVTSKGKTPIQMAYEDLGIYYTSVMWFKANGKYGLMTMSGKTLTSKNYDYIPGKNQGVGNENRIPVQYNGKWGFVNLEGKEIIECIYDKVSLFRDGKCEVNLNGKTFMINESGKTIN